MSFMWKYVETGDESVLVYRDGDKEPVEVRNLVNHKYFDEIMSLLRDKDDVDVELLEDMLSQGERDEDDDDFDIHLTSGGSEGLFRAFGCMSAEEAVAEYRRMYEEVYKDELDDDFEELLRDTEELDRSGCDSSHKAEKQPEHHAGSRFAGRSCGGYGCCRCRNGERNNGGQVFRIVLTRPYRHFL